jgi:hypothetical protein
MGHSCFQWTWTNFLASFSGKGSAQPGVVSGSLLIDTSQESLDYPLLGGANQGGCASWDILTISAPAGVSHVDLRVTLQLNASMGTTAPSPDSDPVTVDLYDGYSGALHMDYNTNRGPSVTMSYIYSVFAGGQFTPQLQLNLFNEIGLMGVCAVNASGTIYVDALIPGATLQTLSGHNYATRPHIDSNAVVGEQFLLNCSGPLNGSCTLLATTDCSQPLSSWTPVATNAFDTNGLLSFTNTINLAIPATFYQLRTP